MKWFCLLLAAVVAVPAAAAEKTAKIRVLLTYGGHPFEEKLFFAMWDALPDVEYTKAPLPQSYPLLNPELRQKYDVLAMYDMAPKSSPNEEKAFVALVKQGIGVVSIHHNINAHADWPEFAKMIGAKWVWSRQEYEGQEVGPSIYQEGQKIRVTVADKEHPITRGLSDFTIHDEVYGHCYIAPTNHVLLASDDNRNNRAMVWVTHYGRSPVFYMQFGHDHFAWQDPVYTKILGRGIQWAAGRLGATGKGGSQ